MISSMPTQRYPEYPHPKLCVNPNHAEAEFLYFHPMGATYSYPSFQRFHAQELPLILYRRLLQDPHALYPSCNQQYDRLFGQMVHSEH